MKRARLAALLVVLATLLVSAASHAQSATYADYMVQAPELSAPERGSVAGQYASLAFAPGDLVRGAFSLPLPIDVPQERGAIFGNPFPAYASDGGISEWGLGFTSSWKITRSRILGSIDYRNDELSGPWGRMVAGTDGAYYPAGLSSPMRVEVSGDQLIAYAPDGNVWTFGAGTDRTTTARGTYAWWLSEVRTPAGRRTLYSYQANASGRPFLQSVSYGGLGATFEARVDFTYESLPTSFVSYRSGYVERLDRRVKNVVAMVRHRETGAFVERWRHVLTYSADSFGPAFYLSRIVKRFASGEEAPATTFTYDLPSAQLASELARPVPKISSLVPMLRSDGFQPHRAAAFDADADGRPDLEASADGRLLVQKDEGFDVQPLPPPTATRDPRCRRDPFDANPPRLLTELRPSDSVSYAVSLKLEGPGFDTTVRICDRAGELVYTQVVPKDFTLGPLAKLVDVNLDRQPDLVRYNTGYYEVIRNTSTPQAFSFGTPRRVPITPAFTTTGMWVQDLNGDGIPDLVARSASSFAVWAGRGDGDFETTAALYKFSNAGLEVIGIDKYQATFVDANRDGLVDVLLEKDNRYSFFVNTGTRFEQKRIEALARMPFTAGRPVPVDLAGSGNIELAYVESQTGYSIALDRPSTSLLVATDDGRGNVVHFEYERAAAVPGGRQRATVLTAVELRSSGHEPLRTAYHYDAPAIHPTAGFLLGFDLVSAGTGTRLQKSRFSNTPDAPGLLVEARQTDDADPAIVSFESREYDDATLMGVPYRRARATTKGFESATNPAERVAARDEVVAYTDDVCPSETRRTTDAGTLRKQMTIGRPAFFAHHLACIVTAALTAGAHTDSSLDFEHHVGMRRNAIGLVEHVESVGRAVTLVRSDIGYLPDFRIASVTSPAEGTAWVDWLPGSQIVAAVTAPTGAKTRVVERDPVTDAIRSLAIEGGTQMPFVRSFRFDGQERLARQWDNLGTASEANPNEVLAYRFATATAPSAIESTTLVDAGSGLRRHGLTLATGAGRSAGTGVQIPEGWSVDGLEDLDQTTLRKRAFVRGPLTSASAAIDYATLFAGAAAVGESQSTAFGEQNRKTSYHAGVSGDVVTTRSIRGGRLVVTAVENGALTTTEEHDGSGNVVRKVDPGGAATALTYDALGRLRKVLLPMGAVQRQDFDEHERPSRVTRSDVGSIESTYDPATGLLVARDIRGRAGLIARREELSYDAYGRVIAKRHTASGLDPTTYRFFYDGATDLEPTLRTDIGRQTAVTGPGFAKRMAFRPDGSLATREVEIAGFRIVRTSLAYFDDGTEKSRTMQVLEPGTGALFEESRSVASLDAYARPAGSTWNALPFVDYAYDATGLLSTATFAADERITFGYDPLTRGRTSLMEEAPAWTAATWSRRNARGLQEREGLTVDGVGITRDYSYNDQGFLIRAHDAETTWEYAFDRAGLPTQVTHDGSIEAFTRTADALSSTTHDVAFDDLGRARVVDGAELEYDAAGQILAVNRGGRRRTFDYDEAGNRLVKRDAGVAVAAYVAEGYLDASGLTQPIAVGGQLVGVLRQGKRVLAPVDLRGSLTGDADGSRSLPSPFGVRSGDRPQLAAAVDYVQRGYDADLGTVRMGARDYAPGLNQFLTPDPLFLSDIGRVGGNPVAGNLYTYARNAPLDFVDPLGLEESRWSQLVSVLSSPAVRSAATTALTFAASYERTIAKEAIVAVATMASSPLPGGGEVLNTALKLAGHHEGLAGVIGAGADAVLPATAEGPGKSAGEIAGKIGFVAAVTVATAGEGLATAGEMAVAEAGPQAIGVSARGAVQTFEITEGVRRAKAAAELGHATIQAEVQVGGKIVQRGEVAVDALRSPFKSAIDVSNPTNMQRWLRVLKGTAAGDELPAITIRPGSNGPPISDVTFKY